MFKLFLLFLYGANGAGFIYGLLSECGLIFGTSFYEKILGILLFFWSICTQGLLIDGVLFFFKK